LCSFFVDPLHLTAKIDVISIPSFVVLRKYHNQPLFIAFRFYPNGCSLI